MGEQENSSDLVERALYVLELAWHTSLRPWEPAGPGCRPRLRWARESNRPLHMVLFRHMVTVRAFPFIMKYVLL